MTNIQKIIKYLAIAFAVFLSFNIITGIMYGVISVTNLFSNNTKNSVFENLNVSNNSLILDIDVNRVNIILKEGNEFKAETNNKYIKTRQKDNKLYITEEKHSWFNRDNSDLIVYIPSNYIFSSISIENGTGKVDIDSLSTKNLYLDLGAGKININNLFVLNEAEIDGGAGEINIENGNINNLDLDMGIGNLSLTSRITGKSEIDAGIGGIDLNLIGTIDEYKIKLDKGIGSVRINKEKIPNSSYYGNGINIININGGVGSIKIDFLDV